MFGNHYNEAICTWSFLCRKVFNYKLNLLNRIRQFRLCFFRNWSVLSKFLNLWILGCLWCSLMIFTVCGVLITRALLCCCQWVSSLSSATRGCGHLVQVIVVWAFTRGCWVFRSFWVGVEGERETERKCENVCVDLSSIQEKPGVTGYAGCFIPSWPDYESIAQVLNVG